MIENKSWDEKTKTIKFKLDNADEQKLWEWLRHLPYGKFSEDTKQFWMDKMKEDKNENY